MTETSQQTTDRVGHTRRRASRADQLVVPLRHPILAIVLGVVGLAIVIAAGLVLTHSAALTRADFSGLLTLNGSPSHLADVLSLAATWIVAPTRAIILGVLIAIVVALVSRSLGTGIFVAATIAVTWLGSDVIKYIVDRPRPPVAELVHNVGGFDVDPSFPSGHVTFVAATTVAFILLLRARRSAWIAVTLGVLATAGIAIARVYLGAHYPGDVTAAVVYAVLVTPAVYTLLAWAGRATGMLAVLDRAGGAVLPRLRPST
jgi:undecaprenyl-diphosphatase